MIGPPEIATTNGALTDEKVGSVRDKSTARRGQLAAVGLPQLLWKEKGGTCWID
jgi:hypothetical protein